MNEKVTITIENNPCPKCGTQLIGGAPHSGSGIQEECYKCGYIKITTPEEPK